MGDAMRGMHFRLSPSQKHRLLQAQQLCRDAGGSVHSSAFVNVGDTIPVDYENGFLRGHGTQVVDGQLLATVCGVVERVNKLVSVRPLRTRYYPETGDVVVGRVTEIASSVIELAGDSSHLLEITNETMMKNRIKTAADAGNVTPNGQTFTLGKQSPTSIYLLENKIARRLQYLYRCGATVECCLLILLQNSNLASRGFKIEILRDYFTRVEDSSLALEVAPKRWKVDVNSRQDAQLMLSAVNLPGGIQRRRTATDELNMRDLFAENDLISAEVQTLHQDGSLHLHTRSLKYGKLESGQLVKVAPYLIKRLKQHFHQLKQYGVQMILGCNGYVWISPLPPSTPDISTDQKRVDSEVLESAVGTAESRNVEISRDLRERICRLANVVRVLGAIGFLIHPDSIVDTYEASLSWGTELKHMFSAEFYVSVVEREAEERSKKG